MTTLRVTPRLKREMKPFGIQQWNECFHCGNCTATCPLSETNHLFPRRSIRNVQMGLIDRLESNLDPWLCYYCGDCTKTCPRDANPGELMMSLRRFLTARYDWTGISGALYKSMKGHLLTVFLLFSGVIAAFLLFADFKIPLSSEGIVEINKFAPHELIAFLDHILLGLLGFFLLGGLLNMFIKVILKDKEVRVPLYLYFTQVWDAIFHFATQKRFAKCEGKKTYWVLHWYLMSSYIMMFIMIIFFLPWFQTDTIHPFWHPQRILGYYVTGGLIVGSIYFFIGRFRKDKEIFRFSHHSDWIFIVLLFLLALTGILIHIFRLEGMPVATYTSYMLHLAVEVPMVVTFVAFSKWSHLAYRPMAIFFYNLKRAAAARQATGVLTPAI